MAEITDLPRRCELSIRQLALETRIDRDAIRHRLTAANVRPSGQRGGYPVFRLRDCLPALYLAGANGEIDPSRLPPHERRAFWQATHEAMRVQERARELIPTLEVEACFASTYKLLVQFLEALPDELERATSLSPAELERVEKRIDALREDLYARLVAAPNSDAEPEPEGEGTPAA